MTRFKPTPLPPHKQCDHAYTSTTAPSNTYMPSGSHQACDQCTLNTANSLYEENPHPPSSSVNPRTPPPPANETAPNAVVRKYLTNINLCQILGKLEPLVLPVSMLFILPWWLWKVFVLPWVVHIILRNWSNPTGLQTSVVLLIVRATIYSLSLRLCVMTVLRMSGVFFGVVAAMVLFGLVVIVMGMVICAGVLLLVLATFFASLGTCEL